MKTLLLVLLFSLFLVPVHAQDVWVDDAVLADILQSYIADDEPGGVVFVDDNGATASAAFGMANLDTGAQISPDDLFRIGSITKPMTATAVLALVEAGEIDLDAPMAAYLPDDIAANVANADTATVRQMLQMTSGVFSYTDSDAFDDAVQANPAYGWTAAETITFIYGEDPYFAPGEDYFYSNSNYNLAEIMIEQVSDMSLAEALDTVIFAPLEMDTCYVETPDVFAQGIVRGYEMDGNAFYDITEENDGVGLGDGGVVCSAADLAKFPVGLWDGDLLSDEMLDEMLTTVGDDVGEQYGLGIGYDESDFGMMLSHDGSTSGFNATMQYLPDEGLTVVVLTNNFDADYVVDVAYDAFLAAFGEY